MSAGHEKTLLSLTELTAWMAERGVVRSRAEWYRRAKAGQFGELVGAQYVFRIEEAQAMLERLRPQDS